MEITIGKCRNWNVIILVLATWRMPKYFFNSFDTGNNYHINEYAKWNKVAIRKVTFITRKKVICINENYWETELF